MPTTRHRRSKSILDRLELNLKKYQTTISIIIPTILSIIALAISLNANKLAKETAEKEEKPLWDITVVRNEEMPRMLEFRSLKTNFNIQKITLYLPSNIVSKSITIITGKTYSLFDYENEFSEYFGKIYQLKNNDYTVGGISNKYIAECPFIAVVEYIYEGRKKEESLLLLMHLEIFDEKCTTKNVEFIDYLKADHKQAYSSYVDFLSRSQYLEMPITSMLLRETKEFKSAKNEVKQFIDLMDSCQRKVEMFLKFTKDEVVVDSANFIIPLCLIDSIHTSNTLNKFKQTAQNSESISEIKKAFIKIDSFIKVNPYNRETTCKKCSTWFNNQANDDFDELFATIKVNVWRELYDTSEFVGIVQSEK
jgi:hypothetical protein